MTLTEILIIDIVGILAIVYAPSFFKKAHSEELPPAIQELQDKGVDFVYKHNTGRVYLLDSVPAPTTRSHGWISPNPSGAGYVIRDDTLVIIGEPIHSVSWYCLDGINYVTTTDLAAEAYKCGG